MKQRRRRWAVFIALLVTSLALLGFFLKQYLTNQLRLFLEAELGRQLDGRVTIHSLNLDMIHPTVSVEGVKVESRRFGIDDLSIVEAQVEVTPFPIFFGTVLISRIKIGDTRLAMSYPPPASQEPSSKLLRLLPKRHLIRFAIKELIIPSAEVAVREKSGAWQARLNLRPLQAEMRSWEQIALALAGEGVWVRRAKDGSLKSHHLDHLQGKVNFDRDTLTLEELNLTTDYGHFVASGEVLPKLGLNLASQLEMQHLNKLMGEEEGASQTPRLKLAGSLAFSGSLRGDWHSPQAEGKIQANSLTMANTQVSRLNSNILYKDSEVKLDSLAFSLGSGELSGNGSWRIDTGAFQGKLNLAQIETERIESVLQSFLPSAPTISGSFTGSLQTSGILLVKSGFSDLKLDLVLSSPQCGIRGKEWSSELNELMLLGKVASDKTLHRWDISEFRLDSKELKLAGSGFYQANQYRLLASGSLENLWQKLHPSVEKVFGKLELNLDLRGDQKNKTADLSIRGDKLRVGPIDGWSLKAALTQNQGLLDLKELLLSHPASRLKVIGGVDLNKTEWLETKLTLETMPADFVIAFLPVKGELKDLLLNHVEGTLSGELAVDGALAQPHGKANLKLTRTRIFKEAVDGVRFAAQFKDGIYRLSNLTLEIGQGQLQGKGELDTLKGQVNFEVASEKLSTEDLRLLHRWVPKSHPFEMQARLFGNLRAPDVDIKLVIKDQQRPYLNATLRGNLQGPKLRTEVTFAGNATKAVYTVGGQQTLEGSFVKFDPFAVTAFLGHRFSRGLEGNIDGSMSLLAEKGHGFNGNIRLHDLLLKQNSILVLEHSNAELKLQESELAINSCLLQGPTTRLICNSNHYLEGTINLSLLRAFLDFIPRSEGQAAIKVRSAGPITDFDFEGTIQVQNAIITFDGFPTLFENIQADIELDHNRIVVKSFSTDSGNGNGRGLGTMVVGKNWDRIDFDLHAQANEIPSRFPADFPGVASGEVSFTGPGTNALLKADLRIHQLRYTKRFDWRSKLLDFNSGNSNSLVTTLLDSKNQTHRGVNFDIHCSADEPVIGIKNNLGDILMTGDFRVLGKFPRVGLLGNFNVNSGKVTFRNHQFIIDSGTVKFTSPERVASYVDVYASARVQEYNVTLNIHTVGDKVQVDMNSTPPLSETDLVSLLTVGSVSSAYSSLATQQSNVTEGVAVGIVSGTLQDKVERIGLLDSFQVVPDYSQVNKASELRLMMGKELNNNLGLIYSTDLYNAGTNQEMRLRQIINNNFAVSGNAKNSQQANENLDLGVDFEFSFDF